MTEKTLAFGLDEFANPPSFYRTAPLWAWNDEMTEPLIRRQLVELKAHGFGGAFVHPRPGLVTEYLSDAWFSAWSTALSIARELDLKLYIYDENSYPSGFAGGHVSARLPDCWARSATCRIVDAATPIAARAAVVRAYVCLRVDGTVRLLDDITLRPRAEWSRLGGEILLIEWSAATTTPWLGDFAYVDLLRPEVTRAFIESTYEPYARAFGPDFGATIPAIFTDEPAITGSRIYDTAVMNELPFSYWLAAEFRRRRGYDLVDHLAGVLMDVDAQHFTHPARKARHDYYATVQELWSESFVEPIARWCDGHGISMTGHYMEHLWPLAAGGCVSPSIMRNYEFQQWPGVDLLLTHLLRDSHEDLLLVTLLELRSVANQFRKERTLCEAFGAGGWDSGLSDYKRIGDWLLVHGVNFLNEHLTFVSVAGARKRDHAQSFDWREPWWDEYTDLNDYFARASYLLTRGTTHQRLLVIHPTTSGYLVARMDERADLMERVPPSNPDMRNYLAMLQSLTDALWDFDLGDEGILARNGRIAGRALEVGHQRYDIVLLSGDMTNMAQSTLSLLQEFLDSGGTVLSQGRPGSSIDGVDVPEEYDALFARAGVELLTSTEALLDALDARLRRRLHPRTTLPGGVAHMRRELDDGSTIYFVTNHSAGPIDASVELDGKRVERLDLWSGERLSMDHAVSGTTLLIDVRLERWESVAFRVYSGEDGDSVIGEAADPWGGLVKRGEARAKLVAVEAEEPNLLPIDYCDLEIDGKNYERMNTIRAGIVAFQHRGFGQNPWDNAVQFERRILDRNTYDEGSGLAVRYHFFVQPGFRPRRLEVLAERPELIGLSVNGAHVNAAQLEHRLDHHLGVYDIAALTRDGQNTVAVDASRFDVRLEIEPVILAGEFAVRASGDHWELAPPQRLGIGVWSDQGMPFYPGAVRYHYRVELEPGDRAIELIPGATAGTSTSLYVEGRRVGTHELHGRLRIPVTPGSRTIEVDVRVSGSLKNLFGPHHDPARPRNEAWPGMWKQAPATGMPAPDAYDVIAYGLIEPPRFVRLRA